MKTLQKLFALACFAYVLGVIVYTVVDYTNIKHPMLYLTAFFIVGVGSLSFKNSKK